MKMTDKGNKTLYFDHTHTSEVYRTYDLVDDKDRTFIYFIGGFWQYMDNYGRLNEVITILTIKE